MVPFVSLGLEFPTPKMALETTVLASTPPSSIGPIMDILRNWRNAACFVDDV